MPSQTTLETSLQRNVIANLSNAVKMLSVNLGTKDMLWYDQFHQKIFTLIGAPGSREWSDIDDLWLTKIMQERPEFPRINVETVARAVRLYAATNIRNEPRDWMATLTWDGIPRIAAFLHDCMGADDSEYTSTVSRNFWVSLAARVFNPGCQMDTMVVLEGSQGIGKSRALRVIGGKWYAEAHESVTNKDFFLLLPGKLLLEIAELDSFRRAEVTAIKRVISCAVDRYRAPYGHSAQDYARTSVFVGTTNESEYLKDSTGARRFWPVRCGKIELSFIENSRNQLFAEAVAAFKSGSSWWQAPPGIADVHESRREADPWEEPIREYLIGKDEVRIHEVAAIALLMDARYQNRAVEHRIGRVLRLHGWASFQKRNGAAMWRVWRPK